MYWQIDLNVGLIFGRNDLRIRETECMSEVLKIKQNQMVIRYNKYRNTIGR